MSKLSPKFIICEGVIGSGKSTLLTQLKQILENECHLRVCIIPEPVDIWESTGALKHFYENVSTAAYQFQVNISLQCCFFPCLFFLL